MSTKQRVEARHGLLAKKVGMTRIFNEAGVHVPVTVLHVEASQVTAHLTAEKNGYTAVQIGAFAKKAQRTSKPLVGHFAKNGVEPKQKLVEFRMSGELPAIGSAISTDLFKAGQLVDITGTTKGRGFTGAMKRWNFGGLRATHGVSISHRSIGGTAGRQDPGRVFKNKKMAGHYGVETVTTQNLEVVQVNAEEGLLLIKGSVAGHNGAWVIVRDAVKGV
ncbi:MAG TPA: 50S ribosomal protein L3 [Alphaproteobacteria bacterium]|nr:50S ribosomal protein L3 [Alphaproteobacteria bacterium]